MRTARVWIVQRDDVARRQTEGAERRPHRERRRAEMHRHVRRVRHHPPTRIEDRAREVVPLLDVRREAAAAEDDAHLVGDRGEPVVEHGERDRIQPPRAHRVSLRFDSASTTARHPGATRMVELYSRRSAGPRSTVPGGRRSRA